MSLLNRNSFKIVIRRGLAANVNTNTFPISGELAYTTDDKQLWIGDGTNFNGLDSRYLKVVSVPVSATASGIAGQVAYDASYFYICVAANTWRRVAISSW